MEDYKEKYKQALERAKNYHKGHTLDVNPQAAMEYVFPELKENEDERTRKEIIQFLQLPHPQFVGKRNHEEWIAWLEKQGEYKANEIHPIFRVGDYIRNKKTNNKVLIEQLDVKLKTYCYTSYDGAAEIHSDFPFSKQDEWELIGQRIVEQKPMDTTELEMKRHNEGYVKGVHDAYDNINQARSILKQLRKERPQQDMLSLEQKSQDKPALDVWKDMRLEVYQQASGNRHEPNYSDNRTKMFSLTDIDEIFEKVAEKQGEQKPNLVFDIEIPFGAKDSELQEVSYCIPEGFYAEIDKNKVVIKKVEQKFDSNCLLSWSEIDEKMLNDVISILEPISLTTYSCYAINSMTNWLKSLKERIKGK